MIWHVFPGFHLYFTDPAQHIVTTDIYIHAIYFTGYLDGLYRVICLVYIYYMYMPGASLNTSIIIRTVSFLALVASKRVGYRRVHVSILTHNISLRQTCSMVWMV